MFHRPKTEQQSETIQPEQKSAPQQFAPAQRSPMQSSEAAVMPSAQAPVEAAPEQKQEITQEKEENTMQYDQQDSHEKEERQMEASAPAGAPFQRPPQMQRSVPGFAGSSYNSPSYGSAEAAHGEDRRLVIGQGITMSGEIEACDYLLVEGTLEAALKGAKILEIAQSGTFYGAVEIEEATVAGRFEGDLTVNGRLTIKSGGSVTGSVAYKELAVEAGATLDGKISPLASMGAARSADAPKKKMAPRNDNAGNEEPSHELPFSGEAAAAE